MPRKTRQARQTNTDTPAADAPQEARQGPLPLSPTAQALVDSIERDYALTDPVRALLRIIAEHMTRAEQCDEVLAREGLLLPDLKGAAKVHPLMLLQRDHRNAASAGLQRLLSNIAGG